MVMPMTPEEFQELKRSVERIERAVIGEEASGTVGLVKRVSVLEGKVGDLVLRAMFVSGGVAVIVWLAKAAWAASK